MSGLKPMLVKEFTEIVRTWRIWLIAGAFAFFGMADPLFTRFRNAILGSVVGDELPVADLPEPTYVDSWVQWTGDLTQLLLIIVLVVAAASVAAETSSGTLVMPLTKPVGRASFVVAKFISVVATVCLGAVIGTGLVCGVSAALFDDPQFAQLWRAVGVWLVLTVMMVAITIAASCLVSSTVAAFGIGFGIYMVMSMVAFWQPSRVYSPTGLSEVIGLLAHGQPADLAWPIGTAVLTTAGALVVAIAIFRRREL